MKKMESRSLADFVSGTGYYATPQGRKVLDRKWREILDGVEAEQQAILDKYGPKNAAKSGAGKSNSRR